MEVKVKASVVMRMSQFDYEDYLEIHYSYKVKGLKKTTRHIPLASKGFNEKEDEYSSRILDTLNELSKEEVVAMVKKRVVKDIDDRLRDEKLYKSKKELLKELNNIKFNFKYE